MYNYGEHVYTSGLDSKIKMPQEINRCKNLKITVNNGYFEQYCALGHIIIYSKNKIGQLHLDCDIPTEELECSDYCKGIALTYDEVRERLGLKLDKNNG